MSFDPHFALSQMLPLAEAAYDITKLPAGWELVSTIQPCDFGFIAKSQDATVVSFRGTQHANEWLEDFDGLVVPCKFGSGLVHEGFQLQYSALRDSVTDGLLKADCRKRPIWITGHSLGAALAILCARDVAAIAHSLTITFAGPRVGFPDFANTFDDLIPDCYRIVNKWDIVPHLPSAINLYKHVGTGVELNPGRPHDLAEAHSLELSYRPGLEKVIEQLNAKALPGTPSPFRTPLQQPAQTMPMGKVA